MYYRLSVLMFFQYAIPGAWIPLFALRLEEELRFTPMQTSLAYASWAIGAVIASLVAGQVADRWVSTERCLAGCGCIAGTLLFVLSESTQPFTVCLISILTCLFMIPILTLGLTLSMTHLPDPEKQFGRVRLWGTIGWVFSGLVLWLWFSSALEPVRLWIGQGSVSFADCQRLSGFFAFCLALYALTLPHTPPARKAKSWLAPLAAVHLLKQSRFAILCLCAFCMHLTIPFVIQQTSLLLRHLGLSKGIISSTLTLAQVGEIVWLWFLPVITFRIGMRGTLLAGLIAWTLAMTILMVGQPLGLVIGSFCLNGLFITCFIIRGQVFINRQAGTDIRASAQGLFTMINGIGLLLGNLLVGAVRQVFHQQFAPTFGVGVLIGLTAIVIFALGFSKKGEGDVHVAEPVEDKGEPVIEMGEPVPQPVAQGADV